jgi:hypothetical protein
MIYNVVKAIVNHQYFHGLYHQFMEQGMDYYCFTNTISHLDEFL